MSVESRDTSTIAPLCDEIACETARRGFVHRFCRPRGVNSPISHSTRLTSTATKLERRTACCVVTPKARAGCAAKRRQSPWPSTGVRNGSHAVTRSRPPAGNAAACCFSFARGASQKAPAAHEQAERPMTQSAARLRDRHSDRAADLQARGSAFDDATRLCECEARPTGGDCVALRFGE